MRENDIDQLQAEALMVGKCFVTFFLPPTLLPWSGYQVLGLPGFWCEDNANLEQSPQLAYDGQETGVSNKPLLP